MSSSEIGAELVAFQRLLETYGARPERWPAAERLRFAPLAVSSPEAARLLSEAAALDKLLALAEEPRPGHEDALVDRIMAQLPDEEADASHGSYAGPSVAAARASRTDGGARRVVRAPAALMAASLLLGVVTGASGVLDEAMQPLAETMFGSTEETDDATRLTFGGEADGLLEEGAL